MERNNDPGPLKGSQSATTRSEPSETEWLDKELSGQLLALIRSAKSSDGDLGALRSRSQPDVFQYLWNNRCFKPGRPPVEFLLLEDMCNKLGIGFSKLNAKQPKFSQPPLDPTFNLWFEKRKPPRRAKDPRSPLRSIKQESPVSPTLGSETQPGASSHSAKTSQTSLNQGMSGTVPQSPIPPNTAAAGSSAQRSGQVVGNAIRKNQEDDGYIGTELLDMQARGYLKLDMVSTWSVQE
ncbi:uncharacterized protein J7T54_007495 [Emericellopsis cladophorae]|uniref:Uncharacterized protein n=1 Tax=Emericellopsis cladophorae TaxID=2686198 RepID=A0A9Q0BDB7_9HYPO|nr:uncharacterized protein J7T54_007495 [Emericellopsis cladophorae]KAI6780019.1 hypothetical protein J7T54_007495 [Emericellopsis cladophorae]